MAVKEIWTQAAWDGDVSIPVRLYDPAVRYADGGMVSQAERVRRQGSMGDDVLIHVNPHEFQQMVHAWGDPTFNDSTGLPEWGLGRLAKKLGHGLKNVVKSKWFGTLAPIAASIFLPGIGGLIAQSLIGAANSKLNGGNAVTGALTGAATHFIGGGNTAVGGAGPSTISNLIGKIPGGEAGPAGTIGTDAAGVPTSVPTDVMVPSSPPPTGALGKMGATVKPMLSKMAGYGESNLGRFGTSVMMQGMRDAQSGYANASRAAAAAQDPNNPGGGGALSNFGEPLPQLKFGRKRTEPSDYFTYGETSGPHQFFDPNEIPFYDPNNPTQTEPVGRASGGGVRGPGTGRSDEIDARLSDGEYVMDAETVAMLGDGSVDAGARKLDELRHRLRKHKGKALVKGKISPDARDPEHYMSKGGTVLKALKGGTPKQSVEERLAQLLMMQRMANAYKDVSRTPKEITPEELMDIPIVKKAEGGKVNAGKSVRSLIDMANRLQEAYNLDQGSADVGDISERIDSMIPGASGKIVATMSKGGSVAELIASLMKHFKPTVAEKAPSLDRRIADRRVNANLMDAGPIADQLRAINPESPILKQYDFEQQKKNLMTRKQVYDLLTQGEEQ